MAVIDRVSEIVAPLVTSLDLTVYDIEQAGPILRISVDKPSDPNGPSGADLTRLTRMVSSALDEIDPVPGSYTLEITSPGLERKLRTAQHFAGAIGTRVKLKLEPHLEIRRIDGVLAAADSETITVRGVDEADVVIRLDDITTARTVFEWGPAPKPGKGTKPGKSGSKKTRKTRKTSAEKPSAETSQTHSAERSAG
jgi:ribosome maturation factor RimP